MAVFISYSRQDSDFVDLLYRLLQSKGYEVWVDRGSIGAGSRWDMSIQNAIDEASHLIVVLSPEAAESQNVADEWSYALEENKTVIPLYYRQCSIPMRLRRLQWVDFERETFAIAFKNLVKELGLPDHRSDDRVELAKREGLIYIKLRGTSVRIVFIYSDFPQAGRFLNTVWFTLIWHVVDRSTVTQPYYDYGVKWVLRNVVSGDTYDPPEADTLLHEMGIEPGSQLEIILLKDT